MIERKLISEKNRLVLLAVFIFLILIISFIVLNLLHAGPIYSIITVELDFAIIAVIYIGFKLVRSELSSGRFYARYMIQFPLMAIIITLLALYLWWGMNGFGVLQNPGNELLRFFLIIPLLIYIVISIAIALFLRNYWNKQ